MNRKTYTIAAQVALMIVGAVMLSACSGHEKDHAKTDTPATGDEMVEHSGHAHEDEAQPQKVAGQPQTTCPVMGGAINKALFVDHDGKRIYLCCAGCTGAVKADPAKYIKKLEDQGIALDKAPE